MAGALSRKYEAEPPAEEQWLVNDLVLARMAPTDFYWGLAQPPLTRHPQFNAVQVVDKRFNPWKPMPRYVWPCGEFKRNLTAEVKKNNAARLIQRRFRKYRRADRRAKMSGRADRRANIWWVATPEHERLGSVRAGLGLRGVD